MVIDPKKNESLIDLIATKQMEYLKPVLIAARIQDKGLIKGPVDFNFDQKTSNLIIDALSLYIIKFCKSDEQFYIDNFLDNPVFPIMKKEIEMIWEAIKNVGIAEGSEKDWQNAALERSDNSNKVEFQAIKREFLLDGYIYSTGEIKNLKRHFENNLLWMAIEYYFGTLRPRRVIRKVYKMG